MRTLRIMEGVYRRGMQEEVMLEPGVVHTIFPCLDQLLDLHSGFLSALLKRRKEGLTEGSATNFVVRSIGDLLLKQVRPSETFHVEPMSPGSVRSRFWVLLMKFCLVCVQFSGQSADDMKKLYSEFCSRHPKAVKLYKEVLTRDRRLQQFTRVGPAAEPASGLFLL